MRVILQRVKAASVAWIDDAGEHRNRIGSGLALLVGAGPESDEAQARRLAEKVANLRIFRDEQGRTNVSLLDVGGEALVVSQFTLYADMSRGRRPSFLAAGDPARAKHLVDTFTRALEALGVAIKEGSFGAEMVVTVENDGPVTLALSTDDWATRV